MSIEVTILRNLIHNEAYARKVLPFLKPEYFQVSAERLVFENVGLFFGKYNALPSPEALNIMVNDATKVAASDHAQAISLVHEIKNPPEKVSDEWLSDQTEKFCQDRAITNAIIESISIIDGNNKTKTKEALPEILKEALAVSFDNSVGHDFLNDSEDRYVTYHSKEEKLPFDLSLLNEITDGGLAKKTLTVLLASTGVGKTLVMCHMAAANLTMGKNVLYITNEMAEERIAERIDANLLNVDINDIKTLPKSIYINKIDAIHKRTVGRMIIKEYPTASAHVGHFRHLLNELLLKKDFKPDIIYIDYLNICASSRIKPGSNINSYTYIKSIAEEIRGLATEFGVPIVTATQTNRSGYENSDIDLSNTSESFGLPATADLMLALIATEDLRVLNQMMFKQLKNRYNDPSKLTKFVVGIDRPKMRLYDVEQEASEDLSVMDNSNFGQREKEDSVMKWATKTKGRKDFNGLV